MYSQIALHEHKAIGPLLESTAATACAAGRQRDVRWLGVTKWIAAGCPPHFREILRLGCECHSAVGKDVPMLSHIALRQMDTDLLSG